MNLSRTRIFAAGLALAATLALAGCGAADKVATSASAAEAVRQAGQQAADQSHAFEMTIEMEMDGFGDIEMVMEGEIDAASERARVTMDFLGMDSEVITDGNTAYMSMDGGKQWIKQDVDVPEVDSPLNGGTYDATQQLAYLRAVSDDVKEEGSEKVRGRDTTRYSAFVPLEAIFEQFTGEDREMMEELSRYFQGEGFDMTVWIDNEGRPAKVEYGMDMDVEGSEVSATYVMEFFDWGRDVDIDLPPADKIVDAADADYSSLFN